MATAKTFKIPATLGACADLLLALKGKKSAAQKVADDIEARMNAIKARLIEKLPEDDAKGVIGKAAKAVVISEMKPIPDPDNWPKFMAYVAKNEAYDMVQRRLNEAAVKARQDSGTKLSAMGLTSVKVHKVSITKV